MTVEQLSKDESVLREFFEDRLNNTRGMRACYASASVKGTQQLGQLVDNFPVPEISICFGAEDTVTSLKVSFDSWHLDMKSNVSLRKDRSSVP